jgi:ElaB/YqjD/DUF883 family membrane-anchored ribosome-binding protein
MSKKIFILIILIPIFLLSQDDFVIQKKEDNEKKYSQLRDELIEEYERLLRCHGDCLRKIADAQGKCIDALKKTVEDVPKMTRERVKKERDRIKKLSDSLEAIDFF